jgi:hypothetical protein
MPATIASKPQVDRPPVFLREYTTADHQTRWLMGQRVDDVPRVIDIPASGHAGKGYVVEPDVREPDGSATNDVLEALLDDYIAKAKRLGYPPMHGWF